jgi:mitochondrial fission protein ELM1
MSEKARPRIWVLHGPRKGDNNQSLALVEQLGWPFETRSLRFNLKRLISGRLLGSTLTTVQKPLRRFITPPWPDLVIASGRHTVPPARYIKRQSGERTKIVLIGHPRIDVSEFDLIVTAPQYPVPDHPNVLVSPLVISRIMPGIEADDEERALLDSLPRPHVLMAVGGSTWHYKLVPERMAEAAAKLAARADAAGGTLIAIGSPRTKQPVLDAIAAQLAGTRHVMVPIHKPRFPVLVNDADEMFVTSDSLSMMSEAVLTGKPAGLIPVTVTATGREWVRGERPPREGEPRMRDLSRIWTELLDAGVIGTIDEPRSGAAEDPVVAAANATRKLFE